MSTRSFISKVLPDDSIAGVYCHFDGYPAGVGKVLSQHYKDPQKVDALIALGALSELHPTLEATVAYHRDRGDALNPPVDYPSAETAIRSARRDLGAEWVYIFDDKGWRAVATS